MCEFFSVNSRTTLGTEVKRKDELYEEHIEVLVKKNKEDQFNETKATKINQTLALNTYLCRQRDNAKNDRKKLYNESI